MNIGKRWTILTLMASTVISVGGCSVDFASRRQQHAGILHVQSKSGKQSTRLAVAPSDETSFRNEGPSASTPGGPANGLVATVSHSVQSSRTSEPAPELRDENGVGSSPHSMTLAQFEDLSLRNNPTIGQASADINKASALRDQVGRYPNPVLGYFGSQIGDAGADQHGVFVEQEIVRGGKLPLNQQIMRHAFEAQTAAAESQALRVLTDVRTRFFVALAAQEQMRLTREFGVVATQGVEIASRRKDAQEGSRPELLQAEIQLSEIELAHEQAEVAFVSAFRDLVAVVGATDLQPTSLEGDLAQPSQPFDWEYVYSDLLATSPELRIAQARLQKACAQLQRERIQAVPNPTLQLGGGIDNGTGSGLLNVQVSAPFPIYNSNRGNICAAQADYDKATQEITRIELAIKSRLAVVSREYDSAQAAVQKYESEILPKSKDSLELTESLYRAGEIDFLQIFLVRKTYFESNLRYIQALSELAQARARIDGLLLEGGLDSASPFEGDDSSRERVFSQK